MSLAATDPRHGTYNGYSNHGCRCDACRDANANYRRERGIGPYRKVKCPRCGGPMSRAARLCRACLLDWEPAHGTESRYSRGCRCDLCRQAANEARQRRRRANIKASRAYDRARRRGRQVP